MRVSPLLEDGTVNAPGIPASKLRQTLIFLKIGSFTPTTEERIKDSEKNRQKWLGRR